MKTGHRPGSIDSATVLALVIFLASLFVTKANAQVSAPASGATSSSSEQPEAAAFDIEVRMPPAFSALRELIEKHIELQRYRAVTDLDDTELARLIVLAERDVRNLAGTLGYFSPDIRVTRNLRPGLATEAAARARSVIVITVEPGQATLIGAVSISFTGDIAESEDTDAQTQRTGIQRGWRLPSGLRFTQNAWDEAKAQALKALVIRRYPSARLAESLADIDATNYSAQLSVTLDSGPLYRLGEMQVKGMERYNPVLVPRLAQLKVGAIYDQQQLTQAQQRLTSSAYFDSAYVFIDPQDDPLAAPVQVQVREAKLQKMVFGIGASTDSGPRISMEHSHNRVPGSDWRAVTKLQLEKKSPFAQTEWTSLPDEANWRWVALARTERVDDKLLMTRAERLRFGRSQSSNNLDRNIYLQYDRARVYGDGLRGNSAAQTGDGASLSGNYVWTGRYFDSLPFPGKGYGLGFELGGGVTLRTDLNEKREPYARAVGRWLGIHALALGRIAMRAEAGAVLASDTARVPATALFRTGGDSTVRGYGLRDIGIKLPSGIIAPGRYMSAGSVEWQRPLLSNGLPTDWESTLFMDAGAVADKARELRASVGVGTGVRWKSPIGPLQIDLAYGVQVKQFRLHMSVGFVF